MKNAIRILVYGRCQPAGSKRFVGLSAAGVGRIVDANPRAADWKAQVAQAAAMAREKAGWPLVRGPVAVDVTFVRPRPKGHYNKSGLKKSAPLYPATKPDRGKLLRAVEDAMEGVIYANDSQIVGGYVVKEWGESEYAEIVVQRLADEE